MVHTDTSVAAQPEKELSAKTNPEKIATTVTCITQRPSTALIVNDSPIP